MRIAFVGHSYHRTTRSNDFFLEILGKCGEVEPFYDESWLKGDPAGWRSGFRPEHFDCIVVYQVPEPLQQIDLRHPNLVFVPMLDGHLASDRFWWQPEFSEAKVLCFSARLHREVARLAPVRFFAQYSPPLAGLPPLRNPERLSAFFWYRRPPIDPAFLRRVTGSTVFDRFTLQRAPDPGARAARESDPMPLARSFEEPPAWLPGRAEALARLAEHTVYFAPRLCEGIGMSFLEAMALGMCVVAPDTPTHDEYISHGTTGLLYSPTQPLPLDFARFRELGRRAREGAEHRRALWESAEADLLEFLVTPKSRLDRQSTLLDFWRHEPAPGPAPSPASTRSLPSLTLVVVSGERREGLDATLASVREQDHQALEHVVRDCGADADGGYYAAMAASLAHLSSEYVLFLRAGDRLTSPQSARQLFRSAPADADVVYGHFLAGDGSGGDELCLVGELGQSLERLDARGFDPRWMQRLPCLPAAAIRTSLLRRHGFDPELRWAADYDLHRRLARAGARYHNCDAVIAVCGPESAASRFLPLCAPDWLRIAVRHGRSRAVRRAFVELALDPVEAWSCALWGRLDRIRRRHRMRFGPSTTSEEETGSPRPPVRRRRLASGIRKVARGLAAAERRLAPMRPAAATMPGGSDDGRRDTYVADFTEGIDFRRPGRPSFVAELSGVSWREEWGRWSDGPRVEIRLHRALPRRARIELEAFAFGKNATAPVELSIGAAAARVAIAGEPFRTYVVDLETSGREVTLTLTIPHPSSPATEAGGAEADTRRLGLALRKLRVSELQD